MVPRSPQRPRAPDPYSIEISLELPSLEMVIFATPGRATELVRRPTNSPRAQCSSRECTTHAVARFGRAFWSSAFAAWRLRQHPVRCPPLHLEAHMLTRQRPSTPLPSCAAHSRLPSGERQGLARRQQRGRQRLGQRQLHLGRGVRQVHRQDELVRVQHAVCTSEGSHTGREHSRISTCAAPEFDPSVADRGRRRRGARCARACSRRPSTCAERGSTSPLSARPARGWCAAP
jgi:hypothetical protein